MQEIAKTNNPVSQSPPELPGQAAVGPDYGFGLYIHWPYCARICPYCDFNVYKAAGREPLPLIQAMQADLHAQAARMTYKRPLDTIFFGGGTPSLLQPRDMASLIETAEACFGLRPDAEITLEANPNDVLRCDVKGWALAGINRLSLGLQALQDSALKALGRDHDAAGALSALEAARPHFPNHSIDMIYARPDQSLQDWEAELRLALALDVPHLSLYELTLEPATPFGKQAARGTLKPLEEETQAQLYELTTQMCGEAGMPAYEISNYARGQAFQSRHNLIYWQSGDWIGIGPGAHGRVTRDGVRYATEALARPEAYIKAHGPQETALSNLEIAREFVAMGLRPVTGFSRARYAALAGSGADQERLGELVSAGLVMAHQDQIALTQKGRLLADSIALAIAP